MELQPAETRPAPELPAVTTARQAAQRTEGCRSNGTLTAAGCDQVLTGKTSGKLARRPGHPRAAAATSQVRHQGIYC